MVLGMDLREELELLGLDQSRVAFEAGRQEPLISVNSIRTIGGCSQLSLPDGAVASCVVCLGLPGLKEICGSWALTWTDLQYEPTYLAYREGPALIKAVQRLSRTPDVLLIPAAGIDHPRGLGMARHVGYLLSIPTVGVTRTPLVGQGVAIQPKAGQARVAFTRGPGRGTIYVSRGWGVDAASAVEIVRLCTREHRMPEPVYLAKAVCREMMRDLRLAGLGFPTQS